MCVKKSFLDEVLTYLTLGLDTEFFSVHLGKVHDIGFVVTNTLLDIPYKNLQFKLNLFYAIAL